MRRAASSRPFYAVSGGKLIVVSCAAIHQLQRRLIKIILCFLVVLGVQLAVLGCGIVEIIRLDGHPPQYAKPEAVLVGLGSIQFVTSDQTFRPSGEAT